MSDDSGENISGQTTAAPTPTIRRPNWLSRLLWMGPYVAEAREKKFGPSQPGFAWFNLARQLGDGVVKIGEIGKSCLAVLLLDCDQIGLLVRSYLEREGLPADAGPLSDSDWANALKVPAVAEAFAELTAEQCSTLRAMLGPAREATLANLSDEEQVSLASAVHGLAQRLSEPLEQESNRLARALFARWSRVALAAVAAAVLVCAGGSWIDKKFGKPNLALHRPVMVSSQYPSQGTDHTLLVDGDRENLGFHTECTGQQWVVIDLGAVRKFDKVVVYNRSDACQERAVPLRLEVSKDDKSYALLKERKENFDKWTARGLHAEGRYVRLQNTPPNCFHLAEVEVY